MFSYVFMKILESRPERYDAGINFLSGGHATTELPLRISLKNSQSYDFARNISNFIS